MYTLGSLVADKTSIQTKSLGLDTAYATYAERNDFENGGVVYFTENTDGSLNYQSLVIERMTPGDEIMFNIDVTNNSDVDMQYRVRVTSNLPQGATDPNGNTVEDLTEALDITVDTPQGKSAVIKETTDAQGNPWRFEPGIAQASPGWYHRNDLRSG